MATMWGADADALEALGKQFSQAADRLETLQKATSAGLHASPWSGMDADVFRSDWSGRHAVAMCSASGFLRTEAQRLARNATDQRQASQGTAANGGAVAGVGPAAGASGGSATPEEIKRAVDASRAVVRSSAHVMPGASSRLSAWADELSKGAHSQAELQAFAKYREMVKLAMGLRTTVQSAADDGVGYLRSAAQHGASAVMQFVPTPQTGAGVVTGGAVAKAGATMDAVKEVGSLTDDAIGYGVGKGGDAISDHIVRAIDGQDPVALRHAYEAQADSFLLHAEKVLRASDSVSGVNPEAIRSNGISEFQGNYEVAVANGEVGQAFDIGPDYLKEGLKHGMDFLVPYSGKGTFAVLDAAHAGYDARASADMFNVATNRSMDQLQRSLLAMKP